MQVPRQVHEKETQIQSLQREIKRGNNATYAVPEAESTFDLLLWILHTGERLFADFECELLRLPNALRIRVANPLPVVDVCERVQVHLCENAEARVHVCLERQRQRNVQQIVPGSARVAPQNQVERRHLQQRSKRARERLDERVEHQKLP